MNLSVKNFIYISETGFEIHRTGGEELATFEECLAEHRRAVERFIKYRLQSSADAEDLLQEVYLTAYRNYDQLRNPAAFKAWIISIARNSCNAYFRRQAEKREVSLDFLDETKLYDGRWGALDIEPVRDTIALLSDKDQQILSLYYWEELPQREIARRLSIPVGTVKKRLYSAKQNFKNAYPFMKLKGDYSMKKLPELLPPYQIEWMKDEPFSVKWEELMGWFLVPKQGEKLTWGIYDIPSRKATQVFDMEVIGKAMVHGIEGVEITAKETHYSPERKTIRRTFIAQLTDTHCRYLATIRNDNGIRNFITFLDGDAFLPNWGFGEDNCGNETNLSAKGDVCRCGDVVTSEDKEFLLDIVGRCRVTIGSKVYDTVCVMDIETYDTGVVSEQYLDKNGRTILWRRFNRDDWAFERYQRKWSEMLSENQRLEINGILYIHWYDCITDYIL